MDIIIKAHLIAEQQRIISSQLRDELNRQLKNVNKDELSRLDRIRLKGLYSELSKENKYLAEWGFYEISE